MINLEGLTFYRTPLQELFLRMRLHNHDSLRKILRKNIIINEAIDYELNSRINGIIDNFITILVKGEQGCHLRGTKITTKDGIKNIEEIKSGELVWADNSWRICQPIMKGIQRIMKITLHNNQELFMTYDHVMKTNRGWLQAKELYKGDYFFLGNIQWSPEWNEESKKACLVAMLMADGHLEEKQAKNIYSYKRVSGRKLKKQPKKENHYIRKRIRFYKADKSLRDYFQKTMQELNISKKNYSEYKDKKTPNTKVICIVNSSIYDYFVNLGVPSGKKSHLIKIPEWITKSDTAMNGFLAGYFACDGSFYKNVIEISSCSKELIEQTMAWLQSRGMICRINTKIMHKQNQHNQHRLIIRNTDSLKLWNDRIPNISDIKKVNLTKLENKKSHKNSPEKQLSIKAMFDFGEGDVFDLEVEQNHQYLANGLISHNTFKTSTLLEFLSIIDPSFTAENVCFIYDDFNNKLKNSVPKMAFELDEEVWQHGTGSTRIVNDTQSLIETLRKRQNSMGVACTTDKYFPEEIFTFYMETIDTCMLGTCPLNMELHEIRLCDKLIAKEHHISEVYVRLGVIKRGHFIGLYIKKIDWNNQLWKDYCVKKDLFLEQAKNMEFNKMNYEKVAVELLKLPEASLYKRKSQLKLLIEKNKPNITREERDLLAEQISMIRLREEVKK